MPARNRMLPRGLSWPLTSTDIRSVLGEGEGEAEGEGAGEGEGEGAREGDASVDVTFWWLARGDGELLAVEWLPERRGNYGGTHPHLWETFKIWVSPLPSARRAAARQALRAEALPALAAWIAAARNAPEGWRAARHSRSWRVGDDGSVTWLDDRRR
ncbi:hypothetical protein ACFV4P_09330 [Kitasatospora sp. NPDC059795]|uniref:hypothetical protein n=1 Tax=Kitasatospora sp. NPDC059795 TaxID=3346949 RepID=UPI00365FF39A